MQLIKTLWPKVTLKACICISFYFCANQGPFFLLFNGVDDNCKSNGGSVSC